MIFIKNSRCHVPGLVDHYWYEAIMQLRLTFLIDVTPDGLNMNNIGSKWIDKTIKICF